METLVKKILELSSREPDLPVDVVDLGGTADTDGGPGLTPNYTTENHTNGTYNTSSYSKVVGMRGLVGNIPPNDPPPQRSCCL